MENQLKKVIRLAQKTGDRIIVFDQEKSIDTYVIMPLNKYEELVTNISEKNEVDVFEEEDLTNDEMIDRINRNITSIQNKEENTDYGIDNFENFEDTEEEDNFDFNEDESDAF